MTPQSARALWRGFEPVHAMVYFAPEGREHYTAAGLRGGWMGYFASRSAAMGPVPAGVVTATFYVFHPAMVARAIPDAWRLSSPERALSARNAVADAALRRLLGDMLESDTVAEAAALARRAVEGCDIAGRPIYAAHAELPWAEEPHMVLWQAATRLREHRFDGHVHVLMSEGVDPCTANLTLTATGAFDAEQLRTMRGFSEEEWGATVERLRRRGWLAAGGTATRDGRELRAHVESRTDELAMGPLQALGAPAAARLTELLEEVSGRILAAGGFPVPNPMGLVPSRRVAS